MTVENYTAWMRMDRPETAMFYLGGYTTRKQRDFFKKVYADNPWAGYFHFGDIDAGGFYIYEHLCRITGIPFKSYLMTVDVLKNPRYQSCHNPLSEQDRLRLKALRKEKAFEEIIAYMLEPNVKLEQEIVSFYEMEDYESRT